MPELGAEASWKVPVNRTLAHWPAATVVGETVPDTAVHVVPVCWMVIVWNEIVMVCVVLLQMVTSISNFLPGLTAGLQPVEMVDVVAGLDEAKAGAEAASVTTGTDHAAACAELLERVATQFSTRSAGNESAALLQAAATALLAALPGDPALAPRPEVWPRPEPVTAALVAKLLTALCRLGMLAMGERAADHLLAWPQTFTVDATLLPAALQLNQEAATTDWPPTRRLKAACLAHLEKRIAEPLAAPADFARASHIACHCEHCAELSAFLADPIRQSWLFRAAQAKRTHVEYSIRNHGCDVDLETRRQGSPHGLLCTKNQASYERRRTQRQKDFEHQARLRSAPPSS